MVLKMKIPLETGFEVVLQASAILLDFVVGKNAGGDDCRTADHAAI